MQQPDPANTGPGSGEDIVITKHQGIKYQHVMKLYTREQAPELAARVCTGHDKLTRVWDVIREMEAGEDKERLTGDWQEAFIKLKDYTRQLKGLGFVDCLYKKDGQKTKACLDEKPTCWSCPSDTDYWSTEMMEPRKESD